MAKDLVIVESPAKAKNLGKFLGKGFQVASSYGHIADLPSKELGINVDGDFIPAKAMLSSFYFKVLKNFFPHSIQA